MTKEEHKAAQEWVIYLVSCAVNQTIPNKERISSVDFSAVYKAAERHLLTSAVAFSLEKAGIRNPAFTQAKAKAMRKVALMDAEMNALFVKMEEAGIWHMPLKGTVLKDHYPKFGMREMADHDILFDASRADDVKTIMESLGLQTVKFGTGNHDCYYKEPVLNFEMHRSLFGAGHDENLCAYYENVQERLIGDGFEKRFTAEDFYLYMVAHEYKHYSAGGTGLRSLVDTYVYLGKKTLDMAYVGKEAEKLGIADFEKANRSLALRLFSGEKLTAADQEMLDYFLSSGTYGTITHQVENKMRKNGWGKIRYALDRFLVPVTRKNADYEMYANGYPFFYKHKILLPILPFYRTFKAIKGGKLKIEMEAIRKAKGYS